MAEPTIQLGGGNWAGKSGNLLGYYEQNKKFYAEDFTFSRSTTGTYTDKDGYIQEMPYNLFEYSEDFSQSYWMQNYNGIIPTSTTTAPNGTETAQKYSETTTPYNFIRPQTNILGTDYTLSVYVKNVDANNFYVRTTIGWSYYNFANGTTSNTNLTATDVGNGWILLVTNSPNATWKQFGIGEADSDSTEANNSVYVWGAQLVKGTSAKTYFPTTTRLNMPRVDYKDNSNGSLILEPQRTNILAYSEDLSQGWGTLGTNVIEYVPTLQNPNGLLGGYKVKGSGIYSSSPISPTSQRSIYARSVTGTGDVQLMSHSSNTNNVFTLTEEWQRFDLNSVTSATGQSSFYIDLRGASTTLSEFYVWGAMAETGSYPTSYIPTSGTSVTRNNDQIPSQTLSTALTTQGTIYIDFDKIIQGGTDFGFTNASNTLSYAFYFYSDGIDVYNASAFIVNRTTLEPNNSKVAVSWSGTDVKVFINGNNRTKSGAVASLNNTEKISFSDTSDICNMNAIYLFSEQLTDTELAALTT